ncbi:hypothetical protein BH11CYA1_BH11CYA1_25930 [soil metagenome]
MKLNSLKGQSTALSALVVCSMAAAPAIAKDETIIGSGSTSEVCSINSSTGYLSHTT